MTHGKRNSAEYGIWRGMKKRCHLPTDPAFDLYGGRGIAVCVEWRNSFSAFYSYVGPRPSLLHSLDRIDTTKGYEPGNVRWATDEEQSRNRGEYNVLVPLGDRKVTVAEWAQATGGDAYLVYSRLRVGWSTEKAVTIPSNGNRGVAHVGLKRSAEARANMSVAQLRRRGQPRVE